MHFQVTDTTCFFFIVSVTTIYLLIKKMLQKLKQNFLLLLSCFMQLQVNKFISLLKHSYNWKLPGYGHYQNFQLQFFHFMVLSIFSQLELSEILTSTNWIVT